MILDKEAVKPGLIPDLTASHCIAGILLAYSGRFSILPVGGSALEPSALSVHVLHDDVIDLADRGAVLQNLPGFVGMIVDLDRVPVSADGQKAVALEVFYKVIIDLVFIKVISVDQKLCVISEFKQAGAQDRGIQGT